MKDIVVSGYAYPSIEPWVLDAWLPDLTFLCNFSYGITAEGGVIDLEDQRLTDAANASGVRPLMVLTPLDSEGRFNDVVAGRLLENPQARTTLIGNIGETLRRKGLSGVDFDFEYIPAAFAQNYVELVREARETLGPEGYFVTVALAPKTSASQAGTLYEGHDYAGMGQAADYVLVMTYEWGYTYVHR